MKRIRVEISFEATHDDPDATEWQQDRWFGYCPVSNNEATDPQVISALTRLIALDVADMVDREMQRRHVSQASHNP